MKKFIALYLLKLPNAAHFAFIGERFIPALNAAGEAVLAVLMPLLSALQAAFAKETAQMEWQRRSEYTTLVAEADHRLDHALKALGALLSACLYSDDSGTLTAANRISMMLKNYGNVARKAYEAEVGSMKAILARLHGDLAPDVETIGATALVEKLQAAFTEFNTLFDSRNVQTMQKPAETFREARREVDDYYHQIIAVTEANALVGASPEFAALIAKLNPEIEYLNTHFHKSKSKVSIEAAQVEPVAQQAHTGSAITPTPRVILPTASGKVTLVLGEDFIFSYKNNVKVGNATITAKGKGKYGGSVGVTFVIA
jgi:hypothetical protein